ncbi:hypothetical protein EYF80_035620 [Liparis tanakae]|uniref:Uncharacterized protein n=1 Tax=Liparis tanakae TaxID=230148 RepID=A0A4Z2GNF3_9TELE|nr:hypothetical protein EYF80_035620 [Liparis tanakae]
MVHALPQKTLMSNVFLKRMKSDSPRASEIIAVHFLLNVTLVTMSICKQPVSEVRPRGLNVKFSSLFVYLPPPSLGGFTAPSEDMWRRKGNEEKRTKEKNLEWRKEGRKEEEEEGKGE